MPANHAPPFGPDPEGVTPMIFGEGCRPATFRPLCAGPFTLQFDPERVSLRHVRLGGVEVLREIYAAVRDPHWATVPPRLEFLQVTESAEGFDLECHAVCRQGAIDFRWHGHLSGSRDGTIRFEFDGEAHTAFVRNRIGLCVLHPLAGCVGAACSVEVTDGRRVVGRFPDAVAPHQPFQSLRAITHEPLPGCRIEVRFEGEIFETEDQRNWSDASFKTYGPPMTQPFPAAVERGTIVKQMVSVRLVPRVRRGVAAGQQANLTMTWPAQPQRHLPDLGCSLAGHGRPLAAWQRDRLRALRFSHLRADLRPGQTAWLDTLRRRVAEAEALDTRLHLALHSAGTVDRELQAVHEALGPDRNRVSMLLLLESGRPSATEPFAREALESLERLAWRLPCAAGTDHHFAELNRQRLPSALPLLPCFPITPQVHTADLHTLMENLEAQPDLVRTAHAWSGRRVVVSPVTLRPRPGPDAANDPGSLAPNAPVVEPDPRQQALAGAAWTLGSLARLTPCEALEAVTYFETTGPGGWAPTDGESPQPGSPAASRVFPVYHVFGWLAGMRGVATTVGDGDGQIAGLALFGSKGHRRLLIVNLTSEPRIARLDGIPERTTLRCLDADSVREATLAPADWAVQPGQPIAHPSAAIALSPLAIACLDAPPGVSP